MLHAAWGLLRETGPILLEAAPEGYAPGEIVTAISSQPGVASLHDVHVWLITSGFPALSAHVLVRPPATLAATTLLGLVLFAAFGWWWADPVAALVVAWFAVREGREAWHGELACDD